MQQDINSIINFIISHFIIVYVSSAFAIFTACWDGVFIYTSLDFLKSVV